MPRCSPRAARAAAKHKQRPGVSVAFGNVTSRPCLPHGATRPSFRHTGREAIHSPQRSFPGTHRQGRIQITGRSLRERPVVHQICRTMTWPLNPALQVFHHRRPAGAWNDLRTLSRMEDEKTDFSCSQPRLASRKPCPARHGIHGHRQRTHGSRFLPQTLLS